MRGKLAAALLSGLFIGTQAQLPDKSPAATDLGEDIAKLSEQTDVPNLGLGMAKLSELTDAANLSEQADSSDVNFG